MTEKYESVAITFHWLVAVMVAGLFSVGLYMETLPGKQQDPWVNIHACTGLVFTAIVIARLVWRLGHTPPPLPEGTGALSRLASTPVHWILYALMLVICIPGIIAFVWHARTFNFGVMSFDFGIKSDRTMFKPAENIHSLIAYGIVALATLHGVAALFHHYVLRDTILARMVPWLKK